MNTQHTYMLKTNRKDIPIMAPNLALCLTLTLISSKYSYFEHISIVPKVFEPLKFDCIYFL